MFYRYKYSEKFNKTKDNKIIICICTVIATSAGTKIMIQFMCWPKLFIANELAITTNTYIKS